MIEIEGVSRTFALPGGSVRALDDVSLQVPAGSIFGVVGQSGAGKSTLLRLVNALERPDEGRVVIDGTVVSEARGGVVTGLRGEALRRFRHGIGMVFQHFNLVGNRTVAQNVEFALEAAGRPRDGRRARALEMLDLVGLADRADAHPGQLSGGQRQRVGIARALATEPRLLLSDEATSALDPETTRQILDLIARLSRELGLTVLLITHEMDVVKRICDGAALMERGRVVEAGSIADLIRTQGSRIGDALFPVGDARAFPGGTLVDVTYAGPASEEAGIVRAAAATGLELSILGATMESVGGRTHGRTRLGVPGGPEAAERVIRVLKSDQVSAWPVQAAEPVAAGGAR